MPASPMTTLRRFLVAVVAALAPLVVGTRGASGVADAMARLRLAGFATPDVADYDVLAAIADRSTLPFEEL